MKKYLQKALTPNEMIVREAKFSSVQFVPAIIVFIIGILISISTKEDVGYMILGTIILTLILCIPGAKTILFNELAVTNKTVYGKKGIIKISELQSPLRQIQNVKVEKNFWGRIFKYGIVEITTTTGVYNYKYVKDPESFRNAVLSQIERTEEGKMDLHAQKIADAISNNKN